MREKDRLPLTGDLFQEPWRLALSVLLVCLGLTTVAAGAQEVEGSAEKNQKNQQTAPAARDETEDEETLRKRLYDSPDPPEGKEWLTDEQGRQYWVGDVPKIELTYRWLDEDTIRMKYGFIFDVVDHDDERFWVKVYRVQRGPEWGPPLPTAEEREALEASYRVDIEPSHRLEFVPFDQGLPTARQWRQGFDIADMDGDGSPDIVHGPPRHGLAQPFIFLGDGAGSWQVWGEARYPSAPYDYGDAAAADFNGDGHMDFALAVHLRGLLVLVGDGKGNFTLWSDGIEIAARPDPQGRLPFSSRALEAADWNGDGRPDVIALGEGPRGVGRPEGLLTSAYGTVVFLNQGDGTWIRKDQGTLRGQIFGESLLLGDFNADGRLDFVSGSGVQGRRDILHLGGEDGGWTAVEVDAVRPRAYVRAVAAGDFNGNGQEDLVVAYQSFELEVWRSGIDLLYNRGEKGWERRPLAAEENRKGFFSIATGHLDGDGSLDLVALTGDGLAWVFLGDGTGFLTQEGGEGLTEPHPGCRGYKVRLEDLDGDGRDEIVAAFGGERSGLPGVLEHEGCPRQGSLRAWKAREMEGAETPRTGSGGV